MSLMNMEYKGVRYTISEGTFMGYVALIPYPNTGIYRKKIQAETYDEVVQATKQYIDSLTLAQEEARP